MRYLNKIVFINSSSIKYAEIELDGNVHFIGTQGTGKSTLLRAILFFYNANQSKLGIGREKSRFADYYYEYQNSYIVYEIERDNNKYCVLAYKVNGNVAFRFIDSEYRKEYFINGNGGAYQSWDEIRLVLGKKIHYTKIVSSYKEFRKIIYGDNKGLKPEFRKYSIIESKQYQNIPRTIQNVFLNSNLEAKFIKDTIINSISDEAFVIDIANYSKNHLRDFETDISDIRKWTKKNKKGQVIVKTQADKVIDSYRVLNYIKREKRHLAVLLSERMSFIEQEKPNLLTKFSNENFRLEEIREKISRRKELHRKREQKIISNLDHIKRTLIDAKNKRSEYDNKNISDIIEKVSRKTSLESDRISLEKEKNLLISQFAQIEEKFDALIIQANNEFDRFSNQKTKEIMELRNSLSANKEVVSDKYNSLKDKVNGNYQEQLGRSTNELNRVLERENKLKRQKAELKHKKFYETDIDSLKSEIIAIENQQNSIRSEIINAKNETSSTRRAWELEVKSLEIKPEYSSVKEQSLINNYKTKIGSIQNKIKDYELSLYGWLNVNKPDWRDSIGKVVDENILYTSELSPKLAVNNSDSFYGININLHSLTSGAKSVDELSEEIEKYQGEIAKKEETISLINESRTAEEERIKLKFRKKLKILKETISENEYYQIQKNEKIKKKNILLVELTGKATKEKAATLCLIEEELEKLSGLKQKVDSEIELITKKLKRELKQLENEKVRENSVLNNDFEKRRLEVENILNEKKVEIGQRLQVLNKQKYSELDNKGADTERLAVIENNLTRIISLLAFIKNNEAIVIEYQKDKRELFDKVPVYKKEQLELENNKKNLSEDHQSEMDKLAVKLRNQEKIVFSINTTLEEYKKDFEGFDQFKKSEICSDIIDYLTSGTDIKENGRTAFSIIEEVREKHYKQINTLSELKKSISMFVGNFNEYNVFKFKVKFNEDEEYISFAVVLKEFIEEDKISEYEKRVNERFARIIQLIGRETTDLISKEAEIEKIIKKINNDFISKNFVEAIKEMEMRVQESSNPIVKILIQIKEFNDENGLILGEESLFSSSDSNHINQKAVELLMQLISESGKYSSQEITLAESFDLEFRIVENDNDSGWVEKLSHVGSEGTDVLVKAMINILLLNVFKDSASKKFKDFKLHCMMDEIGRLHPNNVKGILRFANERNILLVNGSPISQNATDYRYTYNLSKEQSKSDSKKYNTRIKRLVKVNTKVLN